MQKIYVKVAPNGDVTAIHNDILRLDTLGKLKVSRLSTVEFNNETQNWEVRDAETQNLLHTNKRRDKALEWEADYYARLKFPLPGQKKTGTDAKPDNPEPQPAAV
jgi:hypothetical protein